MIEQLFEQYKKWKPETATKNIVYHCLSREKRRSFGDLNSNKTFYVIRPIDDKSKFYIGPIHNLMANYFYVLSHLKYAEINNWIPVVDNLNYPVYNSICGEVNGIRNAWEYYWKQPSSFALDEIYRSRNVILSKQSWYSQWDMGYNIENYIDKNVIAQYHALSEVVPIKQEIQSHVYMVKNRLFKPNDKVLGVSVRYIGHARNCYHKGEGHPIQPEMDELIDLVNFRYEEWGMNRIFLASDEASSVQKFADVFKDKLIVLPRKRCDSRQSYGPGNLNPMYTPERLDNTTLDYLTEMELLSYCQGLVGSITSGVRYAIVRNNNQYEHLDIVDCGYFPDSRKRSSSKECNYKHK